MLCVLQKHYVLFKLPDGSKSNLFLYKDSYISAYIKLAKVFIPIGIQNFYIRLVIMQKFQYQIPVFIHNVSVSNSGLYVVGEK